MAACVTTELCQNSSRAAALWGLVMISLRGGVHLPEAILHLSPFIFPTLTSEDCSHQPLKPCAAALSRAGTPEHLCPGSSERPLCKSSRAFALPCRAQLEMLLRNSSQLMSSLAQCCLSHWSFSSPSDLNKSFQSKSQLCLVSRALASPSTEAGHGQKWRALKGSKISSGFCPFGVFISSPQLKTSLEA